MSPTSSFVCPPGILWSTEAGGILVINALSGGGFYLKGLDAAVWNLLTLNYSYKQLIVMIAAMSGSEETSAEASLKDKLLLWHKLGLLVLEEDFNGQYLDHEKL